MKKEDIDRINELAHKAKTVGYVYTVWIEQTLGLIPQSCFFLGTVCCDLFYPTLITATPPESLASLS